MSDGIARKGFDIDLRDGLAREDAFVHVLLRSRVEHKRDYGCERTGNLFIEYSYRGEPSGIATTTANWWAFEYRHDCWLIIPTALLKSLARRALNEGRTARGGDFDESEGVLLPLAWLLGSLTSNGTRADNSR